jgi:hypothetical protein
MFGFINDGYKKEFEQKKIEDTELKRNGSGYVDMPAYRAIKNAEKEVAPVDPDYERFKKLLGCIRRVCELSGFSFDGRLEVTDLNSGKVWR